MKQTNVVHVNFSQIHLMCVSYFLHARILRFVSCEVTCVYDSSVWVFSVRCLNSPETFSSFQLHISQVVNTFVFSPWQGTRPCGVILLALSGSVRSIKNILSAYLVH